MNKAIFLMGVLAVSLSACKKDGVKLTPLASINITNAVVNSTAYIPNFTHNKIIFSNSQTMIGYGSNLETATIANGVVPITITDIVDTTKAIYQTTLDPANGAYYSLFFAGQVGSVDAVLIKDNYQNYADSVCGIRFINLSQDSAPVSVDLQGTANGSAAASLAYKAYSGFVKYPTNSTTAGFTFEFRDVATGNVLSTYTFGSNPIFHNATLALIGLENSGGVSIEGINNY